MAECARVLAPGGRLALCDVVRCRPIPLSEVLRHASAFDLLRRVFGRARMESVDFFAAQAEANGLVVEQAVDLTRATRPTFARWRENAARHREQVIERVGEAYLADFVASCDALERFWDDGALGYGLIAARRPEGG
jgi:27-O-demethylrifamycin SV methyltransferase